MKITLDISPEAYAKLKEHDDESSMWSYGVKGDLKIFLEWLINEQTDKLIEVSEEVQEGI